MLLPASLLDALSDTDLNVWRDPFEGTAAVGCYEEESDKEMEYRFELLHWLAQCDRALFAKLDSGFLAAQARTVLNNGGKLGVIAAKLLNAIEKPPAKSELADEKTDAVDSEEVFDCEEVD